MKTKFLTYSIIIIAMMTFSQPALSLDISITNVQWEDVVDNDGDGYSQSRLMRIYATSDQDVLVWIQIKYIYNNNSQVWLYWGPFAGTLIQAGSSIIEIPIGTSETGGELPYGEYDFIVNFYDFPAGTLLYAQRFFGNDSDLNDEKFEMASQDNDLPDLIVVNAVANPTSIQAGQTTDIDCDVFNQGAGSTGNSSVIKYYMSTDPNLSSNDIYLDDDNVSELGPGESDGEGAIVTIPSNTTQGTYYILFFADANYQIDESNENNNIAAVQISVTVPVTYCTLTLSSNPSSGGTTTGAGTYICGSVVTVEAIPNFCYTFTNWTENGNIVSTSESYTFTLNSNRNLVANFILTQYTISLSSNPQTGGVTTGAGTFPCGSTQTVTATTNNCYSFMNWTENGNIVSTSASYTFTLNSNRNLVANFTLTQYTITLSSNPQSGGVTTGAGMFPCGSTQTVTATANNCYTFTNWTENGNIVSTSASYTFPLNSNRNLVANFILTQYTITLSSNPQSGGVTTGAGTFPCGSTQTVTATANNCYTFTNWTENGNIVSTSASYTFPLNSNRNLVANFILTQYTITLSSNPQSGGVTTGAGTFPCGLTQTVIATANNCYTFMNWTENGNIVSTSASYTFTLNSNRNLVANFALSQYTITLSSNPQSGGVTTGAGTFPCGSTQTVIATENNCYTFTNWTENGNIVSTSLSYTFPLNSNRNLVANFQIQTFTVTLPSNPPYGGSTSGGGNYYCGQTCTAIATPNDGWAFSHWTENGYALSTNNLYTFIVGHNTELVAHFDSLSVGIDNENTDFYKDFRLSPNPTSSQAVVRFSLEKASLVNIDLWDIYGKRVKEIRKNSFLSSGQNEVTIDVQNLPTGVYLLKISYANKFITLKIIKL